MCFSGRATEELRKLRDTADERTVSIGLYVVLREEGEKSDSSAFQFVFCEICRRANADSLETLIRIFDALPPKLYQKAALFPALADAWLKVRILPKLPGGLAFPDSSHNIRY